ncbi:MAG: SpoIIE family protein phosphatase [Marinilabiliaceae bacterium]|nr:SpoIIE family protein phosphatase [Marinilabiliaceae bacterium]
MQTLLSRIKYVIFFVVFLLVNNSIKSQSYDFKVYDSNLGLPQNFVYCLAQGNDGYLWIGTGEGLVKYDGIQFINYSLHDSLANEFIRVLFVGDNGHVWVGHDNGKMSRYDGIGFNKIEIENTSSPIRDICETESGVIWVVEQNHGLVRIDQSLESKTFFSRKLFGRRLFYSILSIDERNFLVGTSQGLLKVTFNAEGEIENVLPIETIPEVGINAIEKRKMSEGEYWIATEESGFYLFKDKTGESSPVANNNLCLFFNIEKENITDIIEEDEGHLLLSTWGNGVVKLIYDPISQSFSESMNFSQANGLGNNYIKDILFDKEGNYWFATYGGGVFALINDYFLFYRLDEIGFKNNKVNAVIHEDTDLWMGLDNGLLKTDPYCFSNHEFYDQFQGVPNDNITGFFYDNDNNLWVSTSQKGLYKRDYGATKFSRFNYTNSRLGNQINDIDGYKNKIFLATIGGLYIIDVLSGEVIHWNTEKGLPHNNINFIYKDQLNQIWVGPKSSGICKIDMANMSVEVHRLDQTAVDVNDMTQDVDGNIWLATQGKGVLKYVEGDSISSITVQSGLSKNYCYSIISDTQNRLWICHQPGVSCVDLSKGKSVRVFGYESSMGGDFYQVWKDRKNVLWFASSEGVIQYFPDLDKTNLVPPILNFTNIEVNGVKYQPGKKIELPYLYSGNYKFRFDFIGISFKNPASVTYKYKMEVNGEDNGGEWVDLGTSRSREYGILPAGDYEFKIIAFNEDGVSTSVPLKIQISIDPPIWEKLWFYLILLVIFGYLVYLFIKYRERKLIMQKLHLQREVASQTVMLRKQKAEIERKNRDITDSINYAKKIQSSILPSLSQLRSNFPESFVYYLPRDIVSGDFYWFHQYKDYFLVSVADCTGHGVPGAFMSMIGSTLLNDIIKSRTINSPAEILENLDREIKVLLQKNSVDQTQDGMDISIVEIHIPTRRIRLASAKRPVFMFVNNDLNIYKGARRSIGEEHVEDDRGFVNIEYQLSKGDSIYLFSDGYTDQFGGPTGKKFMKVGVQNLLEQIKNKPMIEQHELIEQNFIDWKGDLDQVDDVIFLGIRL